MSFILSWATSLIFFVLLFVAHVLYSRTTLKKNRVIMIGYMTATFFPFVFTITYFFNSSPKELNWFTSPEIHEGFIAINSALIFAFLGFVTMAFYAGVEHSVRIRIAVELYLNKDHSMEFGELMKYYKPDQATQHRLKQLELGGYIQKSGQKIQLTKKGESFAKIGLYGKKFYRAGLGG